MSIVLAGVELGDVTVVAGEDLLSGEGAPDPSLFPGFFPSRVFRCCSRVSIRLLGACVRSGMSPLSIPTCSATLRNSDTLVILVRNRL